MKRDTGFYDYVLHDVFADDPHITARGMFGGYGFYYEGHFFALIADGELYFKVDDTNKADYIAQGSHPFAYDGKGKKMTMSYYSLPEDIMENHSALAAWIDAAVSVANNAKKKAVVKKNTVSRPKQRARRTN